MAKTEKPAKTEKKPYSRSAESIEREMSMRALAPLLLEKLGSIKGNRTKQRMQFVDVQPPTGAPIVVWVKCAWRPGRNGNCAVQMAFPGKKKRAHTAEEVVRIVTEKVERARQRGATHILLMAADKVGKTPLAAYILPVGAMGALTKEAVLLDEPLTQNGASPSFYVTAGNERQAAQLEVIRKYANDLLKQEVVPPLAMDAIEDLDAWPEGAQKPERQSHTAMSYKRDQAVRTHVIKRAKGRCEFCELEGFLMVGGKRYLEAHHIISLADQGADTVENVIALCAEDHRKAHYGAERETLEAEMVTKLKRLLTPKKSKK